MERLRPQIPIPFQSWKEAALTHNDLKRHVAVTVEAMFIVGKISRRLPLELRLKW